MCKQASQPGSHPVHLVIFHFFKKSFSFKNILNILHVEKLLVILKEKTRIRTFCNEEDEEREKVQRKTFYNIAILI